MPPASDPDPVSPADAPPAPDRAATLLRLWRYFRPLRAPLALGFLFTLLFTASNLGYGALAKQFLDTIERNAGTGRQAQLNLFTALAILLFATRGVLYFAYNYSLSYAAQKLSMRLRNEVFAHLQHLPLAYFDQRKTGQMMSTLANDIPAVNAVLTAMQESLTAPLLMVGGIALLFWLNWPLALVSCVCLPPIALVISRASGKMRLHTTRVQEHLSEITTHAEETLSGIRVVQAFANEGYEVGRFVRRSDNVFRSVLRTLRVRLVMAPSVELLGTVAIVLVLWIGGTQIVQSQSRLTFGDLTWFVIVLQQVASGAKAAGNISVNLSAAAAAAERVFAVLDARSDIADRPDARPLGRVQGRIEYREVTFAYRAGIPVLEAVSFTAEPGQVVALVGPTGAGKTTLAMLVPRFYEASSGSVLVDGVDVCDCTLQSLRAQVGIVAQEPVLFAGTLRDNIAYGRLDAAAPEIEEAARAANAWEFIERLPEGLDTPVGERGVTLSGGQRQRIAIARAILRNPRILILDEATSALDSQSEALVQEALQRLMASRTTLVIAHRLSTIRRADRIVVLREGRVAESGGHEELLASGGLYAELYRTQFREGAASG